MTDTPNTQGASWRDGLKERLFIVTRDLKITLEDFDFITEYLEEVISKERAEGERRGAEKVVDFFEKKIGRYEGADRFVFLSNNFSYVCKEARTLPADSTEGV